MEQKKVIVTGGAGFIGSNLVDELLLLGHEVKVIDNFSVGRIENLSAAQQNKNLTVVDKDIRDYDSICGEFASTDWVIHLAALADIVPSIERPIDYCTTNINGTINCLEAARLNGVKRFVYAASSSCYGIPSSFPTPENSKISPMYPYALSKYLGEEAVMHWHQLYNLPVVSLRFFNVYGPRARTSGTYGAVFGVFLAQKINNQPFTIVGDGSQTRDFTYVSDIANGIILAAQSDVKGEIINLGSGGTYSINHLVSLLGGEKIYIPKRSGEPDCTFADTEKAKKLLKWKPIVSFEEGVGKMLQCIEDWRNAPLWTKEKISDATKNWHQFLK